MSYPAPTPIYHLTHLKNLLDILNAGGLVPNSYPRVKGGVNISFQSIQERRRRTSVTRGPGGNLHDYVPFYFAPRSPMLYAIWRGNVPDYQEGQSSLIYLVSSAQKVQEYGSAFVFTDGHASMAFSGFYENLQDLNRVDWEVMSSRYWNDTPEDNDRKRRRQAEFLVHGSFPWDLVESIAVTNTKMKTRIEKLFADKFTWLEKPVLIEREWYY